MERNHIDIFNFKNASLSLKILIPTIFFTAIVIFVFTTYLIDKERDASEALLDSKAKNMTDLLAYSSANSLWNFDYKELNNIATIFFKDTDIFRITIRDNKSRIILDLKKEARGSKQIVQHRPIEKDKRKQVISKLFLQIFKLKKISLKLKTDLFFCLSACFLLSSLLLCWSQKKP